MGGGDSNQRQRHPSGERSRWEKKYHFVKLHSKMIWLVIFHWFKWLWWEVQYYFYARVRESLRSLMPCQPSLAKHSWAWYTWQMPENALGVAGFFQRLLPPLTSRRAEKSTPQGLRERGRSSGNLNLNVTATFLFCTHRLESSENTRRWDPGF